MWKVIPSLVSLLWTLNSCNTNVRSKAGVMKSDSTHSTSTNFDKAHSITTHPNSVISDTLKGEKRFIGNWGKDGVPYVCDYIRIGKRTSIFSVSCNQLGLECRNKYHADTLYLYVISTDQGRGFMGPKYYPPKPKSLFAKCYVMDTTLNIIYTQPVFSQNIKQLRLNTVLYKCK